AAPAEVAVVGQVVAEDRGELEVGVLEVVGAAGGSAHVPDLGGLIVGVRVEGDPVVRVAADAEAGELDPGVGELVRQPYVRRAAGEDPDASPDLVLAVARRVPVE